MAAAVVAACGQASSAPTGSAAPSRTRTPAPTPLAGAPPVATGALTVSTRSTSDGEVLSTLQGFTLYYFTPEKGGVIACTGGCATTWPPLKVTGAETKPSNVPGALGTVALADGSMQVTYEGWPLHTYDLDTQQGETHGQGVAGKWFAATVDLTANGATPAA